MHNTAVTESHGQQGSYSEADQILGRYLIDPAEIGRIACDECLVLITGVQPFRSRKYDITRHPRYGGVTQLDPGRFQLWYVVFSSFQGSTFDFAIRLLES